MAENGLLRRIFVPKIEEAKGGWRKSRDTEHYNFRSLLNIIMVIKSRGISLSGV
jgi:hypothetical protein